MNPERKKRMEKKSRNKGGKKNKNEEKKQKKEQRRKYTQILDFSKNRIFIQLKPLKKPLNKTNSK